MGSTAKQNDYLLTLLVKSSTHNQRQRRRCLDSFQTTQVSISSSLFWTTFLRFCDRPERGTT